MSNKICNCLTILLLNKLKKAKYLVLTLPLPFGLFFHLHSTNQECRKVKLLQNNYPSVLICKQERGGEDREWLIKCIELIVFLKAKKNKLNIFSLYNLSLLCRGLRLDARLI